ncbi:MAG: DinB family protein [Chloroflexi bacterium]|nr:DinB family protein [Chloroflexota bacterium]
MTEHLIDSMYGDVNIAGTPHESIFTDDKVFNVTELVERLKDEPQLWSKDAWYERFSMPEDADDMGMGWSNERAAAWQSPSKDILMDYFDRSNAAAAAYIGSLSEADLAREIQWNAPTATMVVDDALGILVWDNIVHGGQVAYLRGYHQGMGWHR